MFTKHIQYLKKRKDLYLKDNIYLELLASKKPISPKPKLCNFILSHEIIYTI